ncbi:MAG TPA: haloacid dehalogenase [Thermomicrobiales bacterium]|nr:haloacid dehalogenase [Thermomicrobiales bacterium]
MTSTSDSLGRELDQVTNDIIARFEALGAARDHAVTHGRHVIRAAANAVRALHRGEIDEAGALLVEARSILDIIRQIASPYPSVYWAGYVQDAMKEYAEAEITGAILQGTPLPTPADLDIEDAPWLNALAEAASELRRDTLDVLRANETERAESLLEAMDAIYAALVTIDFPDAITGGLRRTTDQLRAVLERTRGDVTVAVRQDRLERVLRAVESGTT